MEQFKGQARLPSFAVPKRYDLRLRPDLVACTFSGTVVVDLDVISDTRFLVLNAVDISIVPGTLSFSVQNSSEVFQISKMGIFEEDEILVLEFAETLPIGVGVLAVGFEGILNDKMKGFYRSTYEYNGEEKNMAVTQFAPVDARRCFPCWDEPACKATFKITLEVQSDLVALSNMPVIEEKVDGHLKTVLYQESPLMSTYLVAAVIGLFDYVEDYTSDGIKVRVYCPVGKTERGRFALQVAVKSLEFYKEYFEVPYPLPKLDNVAIPDLADGAMENYGLVTYREAELLYDDEHSSASDKRTVATDVAHELAHQWFGNLVTMEWWTDLWLNEGFATWMSYLENDSQFPEWKVWTQFLDESTRALKLDGLEESHPIEVVVNHASEIDEIFDDISYCKGASIIRMLQSYLGAQSFQGFYVLIQRKLFSIFKVLYDKYDESIRSLASYIKKHAYSNTKTEDLWDAIEEGTGEPVKELMNTWTKQKGYPVVSVKVKDHKLEFEQSQFLYNGSRGDGLWTVPITLCCGSYDVHKSFLLKTKSQTLDMNAFSGSSISNSSLIETVIGAKGDRNGATCTWVKVNVDQTGFYRVKYDENLSAKLRHAIEKNHLSATDRFGILDDSYALCMAGYECFASLLTLMVVYKEELDYTVLSNMISVSHQLVGIAADAVPELVDPIKRILTNLLLNSAERLGWQPKSGESELDAMLRGKVLTALPIFGHAMTLNEASRRFHAFLDDRNTPLLPPDIRKAAYVGVMQRVTASNRSDYESLLRLYRESDSRQDKNLILASLASCPDPSIVLEVLNFLLSPEVRNQDAIVGLGISMEGREVAWSWLESNWPYISETWGSGSLLSTFISAIVSPFASLEKVKEIEDFFADRSIPSIARTVKQSIERVRIKANWVRSVQSDKDLADIVKQLEDRQTRNHVALGRKEPHSSQHVPLKLQLCFCFLSILPAMKLDFVSRFLKKIRANWDQNSRSEDDDVKELARRKDH